MQSDNFRNQTFSIINSFTISSRLPIIYLPHTHSISLKCVGNKRKKFLMSFRLRQNQMRAKLFYQPASDFILFYFHDSSARHVSTHLYLNTMLVLHLYVSLLGELTQWAGVFLNVTPTLGWLTITIY